MTDLRTAAQQALEALGKGCNIKATEWHQAIYALRAALAQQAWVCPESPEHRYAKPGHCEDCGRTLVRAQQAEHFCDTHCTWADHAPGCVRAEPVGTVRVDAGEVHIIPAIRDADRSALKDGQGVYAAPPQRKPLTEDEIGIVIRMAREAGIAVWHKNLKRWVVEPGLERFAALVRADERARPSE